MALVCVVDLQPTYEFVQDRFVFVFRFVAPTEHDAVVLYLGVAHSPPHVSLSLVLSCPVLSRVGSV